MARAELPAGGAVLYRDVGVWELSRGYLIGGGLLLVLQTSLIGALMLQRARRRRTELALLESRRRYELATGAGAIGVWDWNFDTQELYVDPDTEIAPGIRRRGDHEPSGGLGSKSAS